MSDFLWICSFSTLFDFENLEWSALIKGIQAIPKDVVDIDENADSSSGRLLEQLLYLP